MEKWAVVLAGLANLGMIAVGSQVPRVFCWREELARLRPMNRRLFWTYGAFVVGTNAGFGGLSLAFPAEIASGQGLAGAFALFAGLYWTARLAVQFTVFNVKDWPRGRGVALARHFVTGVIALMSAVYLAAFVRGIVT